MAGVRQWLLGVVLTAFAGTLARQLAVPGWNENHLQIWDCMPEEGVYGADGVKLHISCTLTPILLK